MLVGASIHFGVPAARAVAGLLPFRLVTYWLPVLAGFGRMHTAPRRRAVIRRKIGVNRLAVRSAVAFAHRLVVMSPSSRIAALQPTRIHQPT
jgi:hypothetical protein